MKIVIWIFFSKIHHYNSDTVTICQPISFFYSAFLLLCNFEGMTPYTYDASYNDTRRSYNRIVESWLLQPHLLPSNIDSSTSDRNCSAKPKNSVKMKSCHLCIVSFIVSEVKMVWQSLLRPWKPHGFEQSLSPIFKCYDQL